jgi:predicted ATPase
MIISRIILKNWKNFKEVDVSLKERVFIVGPNASGKSNFLDVFRFLRDIAKPGGGLQKAVLDRGGVSKIRCLAARKYPNVEIEIHISEYGGEKPLWRYSIGIKQQQSGYRQPNIVFEKVWKEDKLILDRPDKNDLKDKERLTQTHLEQINANKDFRDISKYLEVVVYLHLLPQLLKHPQSFTGPDLPGDPFGKGFLERVSKVNEKTRKSWLKKIEEALKIAVPQFKEFNFTEDNGRPHLEAVYHHWRPKAGKQREDQFSDGTLRLIGLLWALQEGDNLLLIEEPELSLNGAIVSKIPGIIYKLQKPKKRQVILTSHSVDLLSDSGISLNEILLLEPSQEGTVIKVAANIDAIKLMLEGGMTPADAILPLTKPKSVDQLTVIL